MALVWNAIMLGVAAFAVFLLVFSLREAFRAFASVRWPTAMGTVVESRHGLNAAEVSGRWNWKPIVRYRYTIDGREYQGDQIAFFGSLWFYSFSERSALVLSRKWMADKTVTVHFTPSAQKSRSSCRA